MGAAKYLTMCRTVLDNKESSGPEAEKPCPEIFSFRDFCSELSGNLAD